MSFIDLTCRLSYSKYPDVPELEWTEKVNSEATE